MKGKKQTSLLLVILLLTALLAGCGASKGSADVQEAAPQAPYAADGAVGNTGMPSGTPLPENRKWIITGQIYGETNDLDALLNGVAEQIRELGGYIEYQNVYNGTEGSKNRYRSAELTVRIPAERVDEFTMALEKAANVVSSSKNLEDVTLSYVDSETRLEALKTEEARLLELMKRAQDLSDLLEIEKRLTDVHYEIEQVTARLRTYDNQINYATIRLSLEEVQVYTPVKPTVWERISDGFSRSLTGIKEGAVDFFVWVIAKSPYLVVWGLAAGLIALAIRSMGKKRKGKKDKPDPGRPVSPAPDAPPASDDAFAPVPPKKEKQ